MGSNDKTLKTLNWENDNIRTKRLMSKIEINLNKKQQKYILEKIIFLANTL